MTDVQFTANGTEYTNATPGWSVQESATPVAPGQFADSTGLVSATIRGGDDELLLIDEQSSAITPLSTIDGPIKSTSQAGELGVAISQGTYLDQFDAERRIPANITGNLAAELYLMCEAIGTATLPSYLPPAALTGYSIPFIGSTFDPSGTVGFQTLFPTIVSYPDPYEIAPIGSQHYGATIVDTATSGVLPNESTGDDIYPGFAVDNVNSNVMQFMIRVPASGIFRAEFAIGASASQPGYENIFGFTFNRNTNNATLVGPDAPVVSFASLDLSDPVLVTLELIPEVTIVIPDGSFTSWRQRITITDSSNAKVSAIQTDPLFYRFPKGGASIQPYYYEFSGDTEITLINLFTQQYYSASPPFTLDADTDYIALDTTLPFDTTGFTPQVPTGPYPAVVGNVWEQMQNLCSATNVEIYPTQNGFGVRDTLLREVDTDNIIPSPTLTIGRGQAGRVVEIVCNNAESITGNIYNAREDGDQPITVAFGETVEVTVAPREVFPLAVFQPKKLDWVSGQSVNQPGRYTVVDSTGLQIMTAQWEEYGGMLSVRVSEEVDGGIIVTVVGPGEEIPSTTAPYTIGLSDGQIVRPYLNITGVGVRANETVITVPTGADPAIVTREVATRIVNPFINTPGVAYDRGVWAARQYDGISVSLGVGLRSPSEYSDFPGARFRTRRSIYRIDSATTSGLGCDIATTWHHTVGDLEDAWGALTLGDYEAVWGDKKIKDAIVFPDRFNP